MSEDKFRSEMSYLAALSIAKNLREKGLLSEEEYAVIDTNLRLSSRHLWVHYYRKMT